MTENSCQDTDGVALKSRSSSVLTGIALIVVSGFLFVTSDSIVKLAREDMRVEMVVWGRYAAHMLLILILFPGRRLLPLFRTKQPVRVVVRALLLLICTTLFFTAIGHIGLAEANAIMFVTPFFVVAMSIPLLGERVGIRRWSAVVIGFLGILLILRPGIQEVHWAYLLILGVAFAFGLFAIMTRTLSFTETAVSMWFYTALVGFIGTSSVVWQAWITPSPEQWLMLAAIGVIGGGSHYIVIHAFYRAPASLLAPFQYLQIIWATLYGFLLFGHLPDVWTFAGATVIIVSGIYVWLRERQLEHAGGQQVSLFRER